MKKKVNVIFEKIKVHQKANSSVKIAAATSHAEALAKEAVTSGSEAVIGVIDFGCDSKVAKKIHEIIKGVNPNLSIFIASIDEDNEKIGKHIQSMTLINH